VKPGAGTPSLRRMGVPIVTAVGLGGKEIGKLVLKAGTEGFLLCCHASKPQLIVANSGQQGGLASYKDTSS